MADIFSLFPEDQAWTEYDSKPANKEDYDPRFFAGSSAAFFEGIGSGTVGLGQTVTHFGKKLITDPDVMNQFAPSYGAVKVLFPDADEALNASYDAVATGLTAAQKYVKPEANSQGTAAQVLYGFGQFVPAIGATIATGPAAGGAVAFGSTFEPTRQEFIEKGVDGDTANTLAATQGAANALGMSLPAGVGSTLTTRILSGIGINTGFGMINRYAIGDTLESHNYQTLAKQYQAWDGQAMLVDGVLGLAFGSLHHLNASRTDSGMAESNNSDDRATPVDASFLGEDYSPSNSGEIERLVKHLSDAGIVEIYSDINSNMGGRFVNDGERSVIKLNIAHIGDEKALSEILSHEAFHAELNTFPEWKYKKLINAVVGASEKSEEGSVLSKANARKDLYKDIDWYDELARNEEIGAEAAGLQEHTKPLPASEQWLNKIKSAIYRHTGIQVGKITSGQLNEMARTRLSGMDLEASVRQAFSVPEIKPSDIDAAHTLNDGLHYDLDSSPVLHGTTESLNAHVAAMDEAARAMMEGEPVNVSQQIRGLDGVVRPGDLSVASERQADIQRVLDENGVSYAEPLPTSAYTPEIRQDSAFLRAANEPGHISTDPDTGTVISSNSYDLLAARDMAAMNPETKILHPDTGREVTLSEALADLDNQIAAVEKESKVYSAAAACFLRNA